MKEWYQQTKEEILGQFQVTEQGLISSQAEKILAEREKMSWRRESARVPCRCF